MPQFVHVTLKNDTVSQHVYHVTDDVLGQELFSRLVLGAGEESDTRIGRGRRRPRTNDIRIYGRRGYPARRFT
jgi:hypothetical protein